jgi:hypothetical protein
LEKPLLKTSISEIALSSELKFVVYWFTKCSLSTLISLGKANGFSIEGALKILKGQMSLKLLWEQKNSFKVAITPCLMRLMIEVLNHI